MNWKRILLPGRKDRSETGMVKKFYCLSVISTGRGQEAAVAQRCD